jgi:uncharacterized membrane protein
MPEIGYFHPQIVHFVIAGLFLGILFRWTSLTGKLPWTDRAATALIIIGTAAAVVAVISGKATHELSERIPGVGAAVRLHEDAGEDTRNFFLALAALEIAALVPALSKWRRWLLMGSAAAGVWGVYQLYEVGDLGGDLVYSYGGGVGMRSGDSADVNNVVRTAIYNRALLDRDQKNAAAAAREFQELATRFPADVGIQLAAIESMLTDRQDPVAAMAALRQMAAPPDSSRLRTRYEMLRADAFAGTGHVDSARAILSALAQRFPQSQRIKDKLAKLK